MRMRHLKALLALSTGLPLLLAASALAAERVALVIGNGDYVHTASLGNPHNDAADISAALRRLGFEVTQIDDAGKSDLEKGLQKLTRAAAKSNIAVVFYAGHGIEVDKRNFLVPVDARLESDQDVEFEAVPLDLALRAAGRASGLGLVILDACRNNPFLASMQRSGATRAIGRGLVRVEPEGQTLVAYAAKEGTTADDGKGRNSPYTTALLRYLEEPGLEILQMFREVRDTVLEATGNRQQPFVSGSLSSEGVYLAADPARKRWETVRRLNDPSALQAFLKEFPDSRLAAQAREKLSELAQARWEVIQDSDKPSELRAFIIAFPGSRFVAMVEARLARLERSARVRRCDGHLQADRLASAARCYRNVLRDDPDHELAREGLVAIADTHSHAAEDALRQAQIQGRSYEDALRQVEGHVERLQQTDAEHPSIAGLRTELQRLRVQDADRLEALRSTLRQLQAAGEAWLRIQDSSQVSDYEAFLRTHAKGQFAEAARRRVQELGEAIQRWKQIEHSARAADYEAFLKTHVKGRLAAQALERWQALLRQEAPDGMPETLAWEEIRDSTRVSDIEEYLRDYPRGRFATEARRRLDELQLMDRLNQCAAHLRAKRLGTSDGALSCYREVLRKDPGNARSGEGLRAVAGLYYQWAEGAIARELFHQAQNYLNRLEQVGAAYRKHLSIATLQSRLEAKQREHEEGREWNRIRSLSHAAKLEAFLRDYPNGRFAAQARRRLNELRKPASAKEVEASLRLDHSDHRLIQWGLKAEGFDPGPADGLLGQGTRAAIRRWQASRDAEASGHLDAESAKLLRASGRKRKAQEQARQRAEAERQMREQKAREQAQLKVVAEAERQKRERQEAEERSRQAAAESAARQPIGDKWFIAKNQSCQVYFADFKTGDTFTFTWSGECVDRKASGEGRLAWEHNERRGVYKGWMREGRLNGHGAMSLANGERYEGDWRENKMHGRGIRTWPNGDRYKGEYRNNKPNGQGALVLANGERFYGQWSNGCYGRREQRWAFADTTAAACGFE